MEDNKVVKCQAWTLVLSSVRLLDLHLLLADLHALGHREDGGEAGGGGRGPACPGHGDAAWEASSSAHP